MEALKFLSNLNNVFENALDEQDITTGLLEAFQKHYKKHSIFIKNVKIYTYDKISKKLKYFAKSWQILDFARSEDTLKKEYEFFSKKPILPNKIVVNKNEFILGKGLSQISEKLLIDDLNKIIFSLKYKDNVVGVLEITFEIKTAIKINKAFFELMQSALEQISLGIVNMQTIENMQTNINFHQTTKNIAKIIETQYELNYILPILGEMIDNFIYGHLIYIFLKVPHKKDYKLIWPANCSGNNVLEHLQKLTPKSTTLIEENGKMGIFSLTCENKVIGAIVSYNHFDKLSEGEIDYLEQLAKQSSDTVDRANSYTKILQHATLDALTGLNNRHQFAHRLKQEVATAKRQNTPLCCMMTDIDYFKSVNDTYGHAVGDAVLKTISKIIKKEIREYDIASRYGGEEFSIILPNTNIDEAYLVANRVRKEVEKKKINIEEFNLKEKEVSVTISIGINAFEKAKAPELLYQDADKALYEAKERGRNRVVIFEKNKKV